MSKASQLNFINQNNQKILSVHKFEDNGYAQFVYQIECLNCGHLYSVKNGSLFEKECLNCQSDSFSFSFFLIEALELNRVKILRFFKYV